MFNSVKYFLCSFVYVNFCKFRYSACIFSAVFKLFPMLLFGGLQHRKNIQYLLTGYVYILGHLLSVAVTPSCSTPLTPLKFKSETPLYSPTPNPTPNPSLSSLINTPFGIKFRYNSTPTLLNPP